MTCCENRWPPVYDADSLKQQIASITKADGFENLFYNQYPTKSSFFQGDLIKLDAQFPFIDEEGNICIDEADDDEKQQWVILGNTCDLTRMDINYTNLAPVSKIQDSIDETILNSLRQFQSYKKIRFPDTVYNTNGYLLDFTQTCSVNKKYLLENAQKTHELSLTGWVLFHSCIVRYFARDDGRHDP